MKIKCNKYYAKTYLFGIQIQWILGYCGSITLSKHLGVILMYASSKKVYLINSSRSIGRYIFIIIIIKIIIILTMNISFHTSLKEDLNSWWKNYFNRRSASQVKAKWTKILSPCFPLQIFHNLNIPCNNISSYM